MKNLTYSEAKKSHNCSSWVDLIKVCKLAERGELPSTSSSNTKPPMVLPKSIMDCINALKGRELNMVIQKSLSKTDLDKDQNRLSMPINQVKANFLRKYEEELLSTHDGGRNMKGMKVLMIEPSGYECVVTLKRWKNEKEGKRSHPWYVFNETWREIYQRQNFEVGMVLQVWSFRYNDDELGFALVVVEPENIDDN